MNSRSGVSIDVLWVFFFFQAEDGIRDLYVTGVQTCALPISIAPSCPSLSTTSEPSPQYAESGPSVPADIRQMRRPAGSRPKRSEERRVGKSVDCGGRRSPKKKKKTGRPSALTVPTDRSNRRP